jgi:hypothetical protein
MTAQISPDDLLLLRFVGPRGDRDKWYEQRLKELEEVDDNNTFVFVDMFLLFFKLDEIGLAQDVKRSLRYEGHGLSIDVDVKAKLLLFGKNAGQLSFRCFDLAWAFLDLVKQPTAVDLLNAWEIPFYYGTGRDSLILIRENPTLFERK